MKISRRGFLHGMAAAGALATGTAKAAGHRKFDGYPGSFGLLHDTTLCVGCRSCEAACREVNNLPPVEVPVGDKDIFRKKRRTTEKAYTVVNEYRKATETTPAVYRKHQCMHCNEPCCASVCFVKAFTKTPEGPVLYDPDVCVGCRYCVMACPYYALAYEYDDPVTPRVVRCTMCYPRIKKGLNPGCSDACPTGAIVFGKRKDLIKLARDRIARFPDRYVDHVFGEHEFGGTSWLTLAGMPFGQLGLHDGATHTPIPEMATSYLSVVPLIVTIYPGLLLGMYAFTKRKEALALKEKNKAVADTLAKADEETKKKLADAAARAAKDKERAVNQAVKKAGAEAKKAAEKKEDEK